MAIADSFPKFILHLSHTWVACKRISKFLTLEEKDVGMIKNNSVMNWDWGYTLSIQDMSAFVPVIEDNSKILGNEKNGEISVRSEKLTNVVKNIDFECKQGELIIIVGSVGCGKTSLLQAILNEIQIKEGKIDINGSISYASQEAWIYNGTIRENILFESELDQERYNEVIRVCALERDLSMFPDGDQSFIGEKGIILSGGQKARVNLARSLYFDADLYLLDDVLSAVDTHVGKHIFVNAIKRFLKNKSVILITHQLNYIKYADNILFMKNGEQLLFDHPNNCLKKIFDEPNSDFVKFMASSFENQRKVKIPRNDEQVSFEKSGSTDEESVVFLNEENSLKDFKLTDCNNEDDKNHLKEIQRKRKFKEEENQVIILSRTYLSYLSYGGISTFVCIFVFCKIKN
jgi:ATP-binding cassette subfamily C (CFTR/MRP) protein 4